MFSSFTRRHTGIAAMTIARYVLGLGMLPYAVSKLERIQFQVPAWSYAQPMGQLSGKILLWATMGYSPKLQLFLGLLELIPAILLVIRRTRRVGALLMLPVAANVWVLNMGLDLWPTTKIISGFFLLLNLFLIAYDATAYRRLFQELLAAPDPVGNAHLRRAGHIASFVVPVLLITLFLATVERQIHSMQETMLPFTGSRQINRAGTWQIVRATQGGVTVPLRPEAQLLYFDFGSRVVTGTPEHPVIGRFDADPKTHRVLIGNLEIAGSSAPITAHYESNGKTLQLVGTRDGSPIELLLKPVGWDPD